MIEPKNRYYLGVRPCGCATACLCDTESTTAESVADFAKRMAQSGRSIRHVELSSADLTTLLAAKCGHTGRHTMTPPEVVALVEACASFVDAEHDDADVLCHGFRRTPITVGMIRAARRALDEDRPVGEVTITSTKYGDGFQITQSIYDLPVGVYVLYRKTDNGDSP